MSCCGTKRRALRDANHLPRIAPAQAAPALKNPQPLQHVRAYALVVKGPVTGQTYLFGARGAALPVDERDAPGMIATGRFTAK